MTTVLTELRVRDLGVIEDLTLSFGPGMTALTGETGAGKTLVVEALQLVLGGRAEVGMVRAGAAEAMVEARFVPDQDDGGQETTWAEVILARSVPAEGRSRAWVDGRMAPVRALGETASELVEIHGQHEHRTLVDSGGPARRAGRVRRHRSEPGARPAQPAAGARRGLGRTGRRRPAASPRGRRAALPGARRSPRPSWTIPTRTRPCAQEERLADAGAYRESGARWPPSWSPGWRRRGRARAPGPGRGTALAGREPFEGYASASWPPRIELADVSRTLRDEVEGWEDDPDRLAAVHERRRLLAELRRKYGEDLAAVMAYGRRRAVRLAALEDAEGEAARLEAERGVRRARTGAAEAEVRAVRRRGRRLRARVASAPGRPGHGRGPPRGPGGPEGHG